MALLQRTLYLEKSEKQEKLQQQQNQSGVEKEDASRDNGRDVVSKGTAGAKAKSMSIDPKTYCKLGHFNLLLENYAKGM